MGDICRKTVQYSWIALILLGAYNIISGQKIAQSLSLLQQDLYQFHAMADERPLSIDTTTGFTTLSRWLKWINNIQNNVPALPYKSYKALLNEICTINKQEMVSAGMSFDKASMMDFYAACKMIKVPATIYCWGDLHGDIRTLVASLEFLRDLNVISEAFTVLKKDVYFVFNGDYVDRGANGAEVHELLCILKYVNAKQVFLLRGNHEDGSINVEYGFLQELKNKFGPHEDFKENRSIPAIIESFYYFLPAVLYIGIVDGARQKNYLQFCHGGLEFYKPESIVSIGPKQPIVYERIGKLREDFWEKHLKDNSEKESFKQAKKRNNRPQIGLGYMWSDFQSENVPTGYLRSVMFGKRLSDIILESVDKNSNIVAVFRGHQHNPSMQGLFVPVNRNIYKLPYMDKHFVFTSVATPTMHLPGRGFMKIELASEDPASWTLTSIWSQCEKYDPSKCAEWSVSPSITLKQWKSELAGGGYVIQ